MSTRYYSSSSICPYPPVPLRATLRYFFLARALPRLCRALVPSFFFVRGARTTYIRGLSILSRLRSFSRFASRSSFPLPSFSPTARAHSLSLSISLPPSFSFLRSHRPSPSSFVLPLSLCPPLGSFLTLQPAAFPVPVSALLPRDSRIGSRSASVCARPCVRVEPRRCVDVALFLACTFHGPVPPLHVSPASPPRPSFPSPARRLFLSTAARSFSVSVQLTCSVFASLSRPILPPVPWCVPAYMRHEKGSAEASSRSIVKRWLELVYRGMERGA